MLFLHKIINGIWFMDSASAANYLPLVASYIQGEKADVRSQKQGEPEISKDKIQFAERSSGVYVLSEYGRYSSPEEAPRDCIAVLHVTDAITKYDQECGPSGMKTKSDILQRCYSNSEIKGVALVIDSGGGEGMAMRLMAQTILERNKPVICFIDDFAASAAYGIASACDYVVANSNQARIGSIGCYMTVADYREYWKLKGIELKEIYAPQSKDKNKDYIDAINGDTKGIEKIAETYCENFLTMVESNRNNALTADRSSWGTGKMYFAPEALELGLIDGIDTFSNFLNYFNT